MDRFFRDAKRMFESPLQLQKLMEISEKLQVQFGQKLQASNICMLPSFNHTLPSGTERGTYLALDVGGSNFRVALVRLNGKSDGADGMEIVKMKTFKIDANVKKLKGVHFFDWMAQRIEEVVADPLVKAEQQTIGDQPLGMGLAWSFPIEYVLSFSLLCMPSVTDHSQGKLPFAQDYCLRWVKALLLKTALLART